jgi:hypothetical protein
MSKDERYQQLGLFSIIIGHVMITPVILAGAAYTFLKNSPIQVPSTIFLALLGIVIGFYRVYLLTQKKKRDEPGRK